MINQYPALNTLEKRIASKMVQFGIWEYTGENATFLFDNINKNAKSNLEKYLKSNKYVTKQDFLKYIMEKQIEAKIMKEKKRAKEAEYRTWLQKEEIIRKKKVRELEKKRKQRINTPLKKAFEQDRIAESKRIKEFNNNHMINRFTYKEEEIYGRDEITGYGISQVQMYAAGCSTRDKFQKKYPEAYEAAIRFNELDRICNHMVTVPNLNKEQIYKELDNLKIKRMGHITLNLLEAIRKKRMYKEVRIYLDTKNAKEKELIAKEAEYIKNNIHDIANFYKSRSDFKRGYYKAYSYAKSTEDYNNICSHMKSNGSFDKTKQSIFYVIQVGDLYKIGITNHSVYLRYSKENVQYKIISQEIMIGADAFNKEKALIRQHKAYQYQGASPFKYTGTSELYTKNITIP